MLEKEVHYLVLLLHHVIQIDLGWCCQFIIVMHGLIWFWGIVITISPIVGMRVLFIVDDSASAIGVFPSFRPSKNTPSH